MRNELEPSNLLVDKYVEMEEVGELRYLRWEEYSRRNQEAKGVKKDEFWKEDAEGRIKKVYKEPDEHVTVGGDMLSAKYALQRRGLAMNIANLLTFEAHEKLVQFYFDEMSRESLPGFHKVGLEQIRRADREIFVRLGEETRGGFTKVVLTGDEMALDKILSSIMVEPRIQALLFPLQAASQKVVSAPGNSAGDKRLAAENERLMNEVKRMKASAGKGANPKGAKGGKGKGGKGKKEGYRRGTPMPKSLLGMSMFIAGEPPCFNYNLPHGCKAKGVERCSAGVHKCMHPGCGGDHSLEHCPKKK